MRPGPGNYAKQREQILLEHTAGTPSDLYENGWGAWTDLVDGGVLEDLGPFAKRDKIDPPALFLANMIEAWTHNGKLYALPMSVSTDVVGYNKDLFDAAGVKVPPVNLEDKAWTMEAFLETAQKLTRGTEQFGFSGSLNRADPVGTTEGTYFGQAPWDEAKKKCLMNTPNFIKGLQFFLDVKDKWRVQPDAERAKELAGPQNVPLFLTGKVAMHAVGGEVIGQTVPFKWALGSIPSSGAGKNMSGRHWSQGLHLDAGSKAKEGAWRVYRWLMEPANNVEYTIPFGQPVTALKAAQDALQQRWTQETGRRRQGLRPDRLRLPPLRGGDAQVRHLAEGARSAHPPVHGHAGGAHDGQGLRRPGHGHHRPRPRPPEVAIACGTAIPRPSQMALWEGNCPSLWRASHAGRRATRWKGFGTAGRRPLRTAAAHVAATAQRWRVETVSRREGRRVTARHAPRPRVTSSGTGLAAASAHATHRFAADTPPDGTRFCLWGTSIRSARRSARVPSLVLLPPAATPRLLPAQPRADRPRAHVARRTAPPPTGQTLYRALAPERGRAGRPARIGSVARGRPTRVGELRRCSPGGPNKCTPQHGRRSRRGGFPTGGVIETRATPAARPPALNEAPPSVYFFSVGATSRSISRCRSSSTCFGGCPSFQARGSAASRAARMFVQTSDFAR